MVKKLIFLSFFFNFSYLFPWSFKTHIFISKMAGIDKYAEITCFPDIFKNENFFLLIPFHYHNPSPDITVTPEYIDKYKVEEFEIKINDRTLKINVPSECGVLYWKIVDIYEKMENLDKSILEDKIAYTYYLISIAHYIGDLSQPLHNFPYGEEIASDGRVYLEEGKWNKENHIKFDFILDPYLPLRWKNLSKFKSMIKQIKINSIEDLKREISEIANSSLSLAKKCYKEKRILTVDEALSQIAKSVSLIQAIIKSTE